MASKPGTNAVSIGVITCSSVGRWGVPPLIDRHQGASSDFVADFTASRCVDPRAPLSPHAHEFWVGDSLNCFRCKQSAKGSGKDGFVGRRIIAALACADVDLVSTEKSLFFGEEVLWRGVG